MKKILKIAYNFVLAVLVLFLLAVAGTFLPIPGNYKIFTVQSGSMEPKIKMGSLIFVKSATDYNVGDVITVKSGKNTVTHRIVEKKGSGAETVYLTKGDANEEADPEETSAKNVVGKTFFTLPYVGYPIGYARTKVGFILLVIIPATIIIYEELYNIKLEILKKFKERRKRKEKTAIDEKMEDRIRMIKEESEATSVQPAQPAMKYQRRPRRRIV